MNNNFGTKHIGKLITDTLEKSFSDLTYEADIGQSYSNHINIEVFFNDISKNIICYSHEVLGQKIFSISSHLPSDYLVIPEVLNSLFWSNKINISNIKKVCDKYFQLMKIYGIADKVVYKHLDELFLDYNYILEKDKTNFNNLDIGKITYESSRSILNHNIQFASSKLMFRLYLHYNGKSVEPVAVLDLPIDSSTQFQCCIPLIDEITDDNVDFIIDNFKIELKENIISFIKEVNELDYKEYHELKKESEEEILDRLTLIDMSSI